MHMEKLHAFVLFSLEYGEADRIVTLFTLEHGKLKVFARGALRSRKRFGAALELFARIDAMVTAREGLSTIRQAEIHSIYPGIRADLARIGHALYACELVDAITPEALPVPRLFRLLAAYLEHLECSGASPQDRLFFEINLLNILGYRPSLDRCSRCGEAYDQSGALIQSGGELVCAACAAGARLVAPATLEYLRRCLSTGRFGLPCPPEAANQAAGLLEETIAAHAGRRLKSAGFLSEID